jgi:hypothetical protein
MPYDDKEELRIRDLARRGLDADGNPIKKPPPPAPAASSPVKFTKPWTEEERKKQAGALTSALRKRGDY